MIGQGGLEEVRVGLTCIRIRQRCEGSLRPAAAVAQGASHFTLQDVCVWQKQVVVHLQHTSKNLQSSSEYLCKTKLLNLKKGQR